MMDTETEQIMKIMRNWLLLAAGSIILMIITQLFIYNGSDFVPKIIFKILAVIQFSLMIISIVYFLKLWKLKNHRWRIINDRS